MERLAPFAVVAPATLQAALAALAEPGARLVAGGTDLMVNLRHGIGGPRTLVDARAVAEMRGIAAADEGLSLGAAVTITELAADARVAGGWPALAEAARLVAAPAHRAAGTLGGNLCLDTRCIYYNRSEWWRAANGFCLKHAGDTCHVAPTGKRCHAAFSGDLAAPLLAYGAEVEIAGPAGMRRQPLAELYREDGAAHLTLGEGEIVTRVQLPSGPPPARYAKARARQAIDFPLAGVAVALRMAAGKVAALRVAITGTNSRPFLLAGMQALTDAAPDAAWREALGKLVQKQVAPMRTTLLAAQYRRRAAAALAQRLAAELSGGR